MNDGDRIGRFLLLRDIDGRLHALSVPAISAICDNGNGGAILLLPGGRLVHVERDVAEMATLLSKTL